jgi:hypothetical protein
MLLSPVERGDPRGELLYEAALLIWDEAPMANRAVLACIDDLLRRIMGNDLPFGGKVLILLGDFRQTCPVIRRGTRAQVVDASIKSSRLFSCFTVARLTEQSEMQKISSLPPLLTQLAMVQVPKFN